MRNLFLLVRFQLPSRIRIFVLTAVYYLNPRAKSYDYIRYNGNDVRWTRHK